MENNLIPPVNNLVKYKTPFRVVDNNFEKKRDSKKHKRTKSEATINKPKRLPDIQAARTVEETEEILNFIMPPVPFQVGDSLFIQEVSSCPGTRPDVINLQNDLDARLEARQAKLTGICPIRRELYSQVFDELIRQITINCAERGLLLLRVRNEIQMTLAAYQSVYESGTVFGLLKTLTAEEEKQQRNKKMRDLEGEIEELKKQVLLEERNCAAIEEKENSKLQVINKKADEDINFLTKNHDQLKSQLDDILNQFK